jgi:hypothetical protein
MEKYARENDELARRAFLLSERGYEAELVAQACQVSVPTALNLIGIGRRLVARGLGEAGSEKGGG